ncbi:MAG: alpha-amylase family glycosyl hydrolase, partial [Cyanobacteria bacterium P01_E01_bin.34]
MTETLSFDSTQHFNIWIKPLVDSVYADLGVDVDHLCERIVMLLKPNINGQARQQKPKWNQSDVLLITYGDSLKNGKRTPLQVLDSFLTEHLTGTVSAVHILPYSPYSSDDGFAVIDYTQVNPTLGSWDDIQHISQQFDLMSDLVVNHISSQSQWFKQFTQGEKPGCDYFIPTDPTTDLSSVTR